VLHRIGKELTGLRFVVCDLSSSPTVDLAAVRMLQRLGAELATRGIALHLAEARATVRDLLRAAGVQETVGAVHHGMTVAAVVASCTAGSVRPPSS
jgi:MFS superfamily sulfate permease-like transporter